MNPQNSPPAAGEDGEVSALIATLHRTEQRLEELTAGEVDAVADRDGRTFLLRRAQEQLRHSEAAKQAALLAKQAALLGALAQSEDGLHRAEIMAKLAHVVTGPDGVFERWSESLPRLVGVEPAQLPRTTRAWLENVHHDDQSLFREKAVQAAVDQQRVELEYRLQKADGEWINIRQTMEPIKAAGEATSVLRWFNTLQDITVERRSEERLRASESRFRQMADHIGDVFYLRDADGGRMLYISAAYAKIWGRSCESLYANPASWSDAIHPDDRAATFTKYKQGVLQGKYEFEYRIVRPDGSIRWIETRGFPVRDAAGEVVRIAGTAADITERKQAVQNLGESEARFRSLTKLSSDWFWEQDAQYRFVQFSGGERVDGWGPDQDKAVGVTRWDLPTIEPLSLGWSEHKAMLEERKPFRDFEYRRVLASGALQYVAASGEPIFDAGGGFTGYRGVATDITKRKLAEVRITRLNRVYAVLSGINTLIVRVLDRDELFRESCRVAVEAGGFRMAWIGLVDKEAGIVKPSATAGDVRDFFETAPLAITDAKPGGHGLTGRAIRAMEPVISNDAQNDPQRMMKQELLERGINSLAIIPLLVGGEAIGVLALYSTEVGFFDDEEMRLLLELGGDIAFALEHIEKAEKLARMVRVNTMLSGINALIVRARERDELFKGACAIAVEAGGFKLAWIAVVDRGTMQLKPVAWEGAALDYLEQMPLSLKEADQDQFGLAGHVVRDRKPVMVQDMERDPRVLLRSEAREHGFHSLVMLPLLVSDMVVGVMALYANEIGFFNEVEMQPLLELSGNISFAIDHIDAAAKLERMTRVNAMLSAINAAIVRIRDRQGLFEEACRIAVSEGGFILARVIEVNGKARIAATTEADSRPYQKLVDEYNADPGNARSMLADALRNGQPVVSNDVASDARVSGRAVLTKDGTYALALLPIVVDKRVAGTVVLRARESGMFDEGELRLLLELVSNIAFALEHMDKEEKVQRLTRVYAVLSGINTLIVRVRSRDELFMKACEIAVEAGGFRMAWIGIVDRVAQKIIPVASAGAAAGFLADPRQWLSLADDSPGPSVIAVREKQAVVVDEVDSDPSMRGRSAHLDPGVRSLVILPLLVAGEPVAVFGLHALQAGYFDEKEMTLLRELGGDIAFAIDHIEKQERLDYLAYYDALTGLANRALFLERISQYMRSAARDGHQLALFLVDLERFKNINDSLGRDAGDMLLQQAAQWLTHKVGDVSLLARIGADLFAVVLPKVSEHGSVVRLLDKAMDAFEEHPFHLAGGVFRVATKSGVALFPGDGATADVLFKNAEAALKKAKASGDRHLFYAPQMTDAVAGKLTLENQLRGALEKGEFVLHYQPKANLVSGKLTGAEALIRWNDPRTGLVPPGRFIPVLEETGMINEVGRWALRKAVEDYLRWLDAGLPAVRIAVNVSPLQLRKRDFAAEVAQAIAIDARAPAGLELEITENLIMEDVKHSIATLRAIRDLGVSIAIDDFGTGFSSLSYLSKLPVDTLKIDRSFVVEMTAPQSMSLVPAIIGLAHSLKLKVVAEGVETEDQSRLLRLLGCDEMQGYLFGKPAPSEIFEASYLRATRVTA